jgi:glycerol-3-phosphate dehydrogenase
LFAKNGVHLLGGDRENPSNPASETRLTGMQHAVETVGSGAHTTLRRDLVSIERERFDVAVVGAGIYGAWVALDAAQRGLKVVLVDKGDFGGATSANSQRIVHGGVRYLQHGDLKRMRESIRERSVLLRVAAHLVRPMPCLVATEGYGLRGRMALGAALRINDVVSWDRNRGVPVSRRLPSGRIVSRRHVLQRFPLLFSEDINGGIVFYDAQVADSERLCLCIIRSASLAGAKIANHVRVTGFLRQDRAVVGLEAEDCLSGDAFPIHSRVVLNCTGPWAAETLALPRGLGHRESCRARFPVFKAVVLLTKPIVEQEAVALAGEAGYRDESELIVKGFRNYFVTPWQNGSLIGTFYAPFENHPDHLRVTPDEIVGYLQRFNRACPGLELAYEDVNNVFVGLLPCERRGRSSSELIYAKHYRIVDHEREDGTAGRITVVGVKWTTARGVAEKAVDLASHKLGVPVGLCRTHELPLFGGDLGDPESFVSAQSTFKPEGIDEDSFAHLLDIYGTAYGEVLRLGDGDSMTFRRISEKLPETVAEVRHSVRAEMALTLSDLVFRRTALGKSGWPGFGCLNFCADLMAEELGWSAGEKQCQVEKVKQAFEGLGVAHGW